MPEKAPFPQKSPGETQRESRLVEPELPGAFATTDKRISFALVLDLGDSRGSQSGNPCQIIDSYTESRTVPESRFFSASLIR